VIWASKAIKILCKTINILFKLTVFLYVTLLLVVSLVQCSSEKFYSDFLRYQWSSNQNRALITRAMKEIPQAKAGQTALVLARELADHDLFFLLEKGYFVAVDTRTIGFELLIPGPNAYEGKIKIIRGGDKLDFEKIPPVDIVMASFIPPLFDAENFNLMWNSLNNKLKPGGYFLGNFFDPKFTIFKLYK